MKQIQSPCIRTIYNNGNYKITATRNGSTVTIKAINRIEDLVDSIVLTKQDLEEILKLFNN